jgi:hypothetical protein
LIGRIAIQRPSDRHEIGLDIAEQQECDGAGDAEAGRAERVLDGFGELEEVSQHPSSVGLIKGTAGAEASHRSIARCGT